MTDNQAVQSKPKYKRKKRNQTTLRLTDEQKQQIEIMAVNSSMTDVISKGIAAEWNFFNNSKKLLKKMPNIKTKDELAKWAAVTFKDSPENLAKFSNALAIRNYTKAIREQQNKYDLLIDEFDTINYLIRSIGNNINQLARQANKGVAVPRGELAKFTKSVIKLEDIAIEIRKQVK